MHKKNLIISLVSLVIIAVGLSVFNFRNRLGRTRALPEITSKNPSEPAVTKRDTVAPNPIQMHSAPNITAAASPEEGRKPTPEEQIALQELARRARSGEYILHSENPFAVRMERDAMKGALEKALPPIIGARQEFFSKLDVSAETIAKLTNHASKIAEASMAVAPLLTELSTAKIAYDIKARELLTPEQYDKFKEFETRQSLEKEWKSFGVKEVSAFGAQDLSAVARTMDDLGIRERTSSSILPYESDPSSGNWITPGDTDVNQIMRRKMFRLENAAADLDTVAERNHLSEQAKQLLASMITERTHTLQEQIQNLGKPEDERSDFFRMVAGQRSSQR